jgi:hypothetical protein
MITKFYQSFTTTKFIHIVFKFKKNWIDSTSFKSEKKNKLFRLCDHANLNFKVHVNLKKKCSDETFERFLITNPVLYPLKHAAKLFTFTTFSKLSSFKCALQHNTSSPRC